MGRQAAAAGHIVSYFAKIAPPSVARFIRFVRRYWFDRYKRSNAKRFFDGSAVKNMQDFFRKKLTFGNVEQRGLW